MHIRWLFPVIVGLALTVSCSSYPREFARAVEAAEVSGAPVGIEGPWVGEWASAATDHRGPLWCLVEPEPGGGGHERYGFRYRAGWGKVLRGTWSATWPVSRGRDGIWRSEQEKDLGVLGGLYSMEATLTPATFDAVYQSDKGDRGTLRLRRPEGAGGPRGEGGD